MIGSLTSFIDKTMLTSQGLELTSRSPVIIKILFLLFFGRARLLMILARKEPFDCLHMSKCIELKQKKYPNFQSLVRLELLSRKVHSKWGHKP